MAGNTKKVVSGEQDWDDSALLSSWDDALEEYKKYHSMAVNGDTLESLKKALLEKVEASTEIPNGATQEKETSSTPANFTHTAAPHTATAAATNTSMPTPLPQGLANMSPAQLASTSSEQLKNMMTAWYYAGYYTGFFEGQQKAWTDMQQPEG